MFVKESMYFVLQVFYCSDDWYNGLLAGSSVLPLARPSVLLNVRHSMPVVRHNSFTMSFVYDSISFAKGGFKGC